MFKESQGQILVDCSQQTPPERAVAWTQQVMRYIKARQIIVLASLQVLRLGVSTHASRCLGRTSILTGEMTVHRIVMPAPVAAWC